MDYGKLIARSWEITWKYRALWLFGVLFAIFGGGGSFNLGSYNPGSYSSGGSGGRGGSNFTPSLPDINSQAVLVILVALACVALIWFLLSIILRFLSRGALIGLVQELETSQTVPTVRRGFVIGSDRFVSLLGIGFLVNLPLMIVSLLLVGIAVLPVLASVLPLIGTRGRTPNELIGLVIAGALGSAVLICCVVLFLFMINLVVRPFYEFFVRVCVVAKRGVMDSIREGYGIVRRNLGNVAVLYVVVIGIGIGFGILMIPVALVLIGIPVAAGFAVGVASNTATYGIITGIIVGIPMLIILLFVSGIYQVFESTLWTEGYRALTARPLAPAVAEAPPPATGSGEAVVS